MRWSPLALALAVFLVWAARDGGFAPVDWLPGTLSFSVTVIVAHERGPAVRRPACPAFASIFFAAFTAWSFLSIAWADVKGDAWDGANRTFLYLCVFVLFAWRPVPVRIGAVLLGAFVAATAAIGTIEFLTLEQAHRLDGSFIQGRLSTPISYPNANAALFPGALSSGGLPASRREVPASSAAVMLLVRACCWSSRRCARAGPRSSRFRSPSLFSLRSHRSSRIAPRASRVAVPVVLGAGRLLHVYTAVVDGHEVQLALTQARSVLVWSALALPPGLVIALVDRDARIRRPLRERSAGSCPLATRGVVAAAPAHRSIRRPGRSCQHGLDEFRTGKPTDSTHVLESPFQWFRELPLRHLAGCAGRVQAAPIAGVGVDNFAVDYLRERRTTQEPMHQHSLELRALAQTGFVGTVLFVGFLIAALLAGARVLRRGHRCCRACCDLPGGVHRIIHGSGTGSGRFRPSGPRRSRGWRSRRRSCRVTRCARALGFPRTPSCRSCWQPRWQPQAWRFRGWRRRSDGFRSWTADPAAAFHRLDLARRLNPLTDHADVVAGVIASGLLDRREERAAFARALERNPHNWYARFELALVDARRGRPLPHRLTPPCRPAEPA